MKSKLIQIFILTISALVFNAQAQTIIRGSTSCGDWVKEARISSTGDPDITSRFWMLGYLSARAAETGKDILKGTDNASIYAWINNYCQANPLDKGFHAGDALFDELVKRKGL